MNWWRDLKGKFKLREPLKNYTTFKIGGPAKYFFEPKDINDLKLLLNLARRYKIKIFVIGKGSNILVGDRGLDGLVLRLNSPYFKRILFNKNHLEVGGGTLLSKVILLAKEKGLSGMEWMVGIPGTVGGALMMNAGQGRSGKTIGNLVETITIMDYNGNIRTLNKSDIKFGYRKTNLSKYIILGARIKLVKKNKKQIQDRINKYLDYRKATQDLSRPSAGCIFKNPPDNSAAQLIDLCGLKGKRIGDAYVSLRHANFIVNLRSAKAKDVLRLMDLVKKKVKRKFNVSLEPEIKIWQ